jgi:hypothetical protein
MQVINDLLSCRKGGWAVMGWSRKLPDKQLIGCSCAGWSYFFGAGESRVVSHASWKIMLAPITDNVVIFRVDVILSEAEKHVPYAELVGTRE